MKNSSHNNSVNIAALDWIEGRAYRPLDIRWHLTIMKNQLVLLRNNIPFSWFGACKQDDFDQRADEIRRKISYLRITKENF